MKRASRQKGVRISESFFSLRCCAPDKPKKKTRSDTSQLLVWLLIYIGVIFESFLCSTIVWTYESIVRLKLTAEASLQNMRRLLLRDHSGQANNDRCSTYSLRDWTFTKQHQFSGCQSILLDKERTRSQSCKGVSLRSSKLRELWWWQFARRPPVAELYSRREGSD